MIKKILLALDGSAYTRGVTDYGLWLARGFGATLTGFHVVDIVALEGPFLHDLSGSLGFEPFLNFSAKMKEALEENGNILLDSFREDCKEAGVKCDTLLTSGIVTNEICDKGTVADLVVIGRKGVNEEFEHGLLGSATEGVIRKSQTPVFIAPRAFKAPENPLLCYDGSPNSAKAMHAAAEFAKTLSLPLTVLTVEPGKSGETTLKEAEDYLKPYNIKARFVHVDEEHAPPVIKARCRENSHDLVFMGATRHSRIVSAVLGSTTEHVVRAVDGPFFLER